MNTAKRICQKLNTYILELFVCQTDFFFAFCAALSLKIFCRFASLYNVCMNTPEDNKLHEFR